MSPIILRLWRPIDVLCRKLELAARVQTAEAKAHPFSKSYEQFIQFHYMITTYEQNKNHLQ